MPWIPHVVHWPNGQGVGLLIRRLRVRVPQGVSCRIRWIKEHGKNVKGVQVATNAGGPTITWPWSIRTRFFICTRWSCTKPSTFSLYDCAPSVRNTTLRWRKCFSAKSLHPVILIGPGPSDRWTFWVGCNRTPFTFFPGSFIHRIR